MTKGRGWRGGLDPPHLFDIIDRTGVAGAVLQTASLFNHLTWFLIVAMKTPAEKFSLAWGDFQKNAGETFCDLLKERDFCDVTLVCQQLLCHKVVLAASSQVIKEMLRSSTHNHPLLYFWGVKARDLARMVDFIYRGRLQLYQSDLSDFLNLSEILKVKEVTLGETRQETNIDSGRKESRDYIIQTNKAQHSSKITGNEDNILESKYQPS